VESCERYDCVTEATDGLLKYPGSVVTKLSGANTGSEIPVLAVSVVSSMCHEGRGGQEKEEVIPITGRGGL
jgi:hypothetical protein